MELLRFIISTFSALIVVGWVIIQLLPSIRVGTMTTLDVELL